MSELSQSAAIILGASSWPKHDGFEPHQALENSANFFRKYLLENGLPKDNCLALFNDDSDPPKIASSIRSFLRSDSVRVAKNIIVYYCGHGNYDQDDQYFLALKSTDKSLVSLTTLSVKFLAKTLKEDVPDKRQIIFIDACYAAAAVDGFMRLGGNSTDTVIKQVREILPSQDITRGTSIFCAAGTKTKAKVGWDAKFTMFSGALRQALREGDPDVGRLLSLENLAVLVQRNLERAFPRDAVRPELHTPLQELGDIRTLPFFPNPAMNPLGDAKRLSIELDYINKTLPHEVDWETQGRKLGWYEFCELRKVINQFGDAHQHHQIRGIHGPEKGEITGLPYRLLATQDFGTARLLAIRDEHRAVDRSKLPEPSREWKETLPLKPAATAKRVHKGYMIESEHINSFAMTTRDAVRRHLQDNLEETVIGTRIPTRVLRLVISFPQGYQPLKEPTVHVTVQNPRQDAGSEQQHDDTDETERVRHSLCYVPGDGCVVLHVERALPDRQYTVSWQVPDPPRSPSKIAARASKQLLALGGLSKIKQNKLDTSLRTIRNAVCAAQLDLRGRQRAMVHLSLLGFDEQRHVMRIIGGTWEDGVDRNFELPWGVGAAGWAMHRRKPLFIDVVEDAGKGIYRSKAGGVDDRYVVCVPIPLPNDGDNRTEQLNDPSIPCVIASLSCSDEAGNLERFKSSEERMAAVSAQLVQKVLDVFKNLRI